MDRVSTREETQGDMSWEPDSLAAAETVCKKNAETTDQLFAGVKWPQ